MLMKSARRRCIRGSGRYSFSLGPSKLDGQCYGAILMQNFDVVFGNTGGATSRFIPSTNSMAYVHAAGNNSISGMGVRLNDGRVVLGVQATPARLWLIATNYTQTLLSGTSITASASNHGSLRRSALLSDGRAIHVFGSAVGVFNPSNNTLTGVANTGINNGYSGAVTLPGDNVLLIPYMSTNPRVLNMSSASFTISSSTLTAEAVCDGILMGNGKVCLTPYNGGRVYFYNTATNLIEDGPVIPGSINQNFLGSVLLSDGRIMFVPLSNPRVCVYDPYADSLDVVVTIPNPIPRMYAFGAELPDGRVILAPYEATNVGILTPY